MNDAGAKQGTMYRSKSARDTGSDAASLATTGSRRDVAATTACAADERGTRDQPAAATTCISTRYAGFASRASTVARAGVSPCGTHPSHTAFIDA